ncbi:spore cortex biosynthesis protein YabQ [Halobacillus salinus]|uniref:Spore cortex biosynthesis protein YabQ n=1 Tax=Halobacillus salinus TaxID=192814 RepID=A0A4Z0GV76_9BACI|nr:spore cortex biosynthesis protein YabQ [Halobacillus salinus]TGB00809.1 spore cortex biosynthesis protein YabQ [Halobacillus salinus]
MTLTTQFVTILAMLGGGAIVGASLDTFERFFHKRNKKSWLEIVYQLGFWLCQASILFYLLYLANYGELRVYVFVAIVCGFAMYKALLQKVYMKCLNIGIRIMSSILQFLKKTGYYLIVVPVRTLILFVISLLLLVYKIVWKGITIVFHVIYLPLKWIFSMIWRLLPKNVKKYLRYLKGISAKIKNIFTSWKSKD